MSCMRSQNSFKTIYFTYAESTAALIKDQNVSINFSTLGINLVNTNNLCFYLLREISQQIFNLNKYIYEMFKKDLITITASGNVHAYEINSSAAGLGNGKNC